MNACEVGFGSCLPALVSGSGPPWPAHGLVSSSWSSSFWKYGRHVLVRPAGRAAGGPAVVVRGVAADVHHDVEVARATGQLAARLEGLAAVEPGLRLAEVLPVHVRAEQRVPDRRVVDVRRHVRPAGLEQQDLRGRVLGQPVGDDRTGRAGPDDDVVERRPCALSPASGRGRAGTARCRGSSPCRRSCRPGA